MTREEAIQRLYRMGLPHVGIIDENTLADNKALSMAIEALEDRPTGKWINGGSTNGIYYKKCNQCFAVIDETFFAYDFDVNYCPNCGAYMKGENK